jgi:hypothetical protein
MFGGCVPGTRSGDRPITAQTDWRAPALPRASDKENGSWPS